jgi:hypothetical protein
MGDWNYTNLWRTNYEAGEVGALGSVNASQHRGRY